MRQPEPVFRRLLVPVDGSAPSRSALDLAISLATALGASIALCHVRDVVAPPADAAGFAMEQLAEEADAAGEAILAAAKQHVEAANLTVDAMMPTGPVADAIVGAAARCNADAIVMATHGRTGVSRALFGSRTDEVLRAAKIPVIIAPHVA